jgi:hypothetical protein
MMAGFPAADTGSSHPSSRPDTLWGPFSGHVLIEVTWKPCRARAARHHGPLEMRREGKACVGMNLAQRIEDWLRTRASRRPKKYVPLTQDKYLGETKDEAEPADVPAIRAAIRTASERGQSRRKRAREELERVRETLLMGQVGAEPSFLERLALTLHRTWRLR